MLMFRKVSFLFRLLSTKENKKRSLELRHQRTCDVFFDIQNDLLYPDGKEFILDSISKENVYGLIETLLPKAAYNKEHKRKFKMMELWADN